MGAHSSFSRGLAGAARAGLALLLVSTTIATGQPSPAAHGALADAVDPAGADDTRERALAEVGVTLVPALVELAEWCSAQRLLAARLAAYEAVLEWQPDHADARRILGWRRVASGEWERARPEQARKDRTGLEAELAARHADLVRLTLDASEQRAEALGRVGLETARRRLLKLVPDDEALRAALDETRLPSGAWARADAVRALERAAARKAEVARAKAALVAPVRLDASALGPLQGTLKWISVARTPRAFVAGTIGFAESAAIAVAVDITPDIVSAAVPGAALPGLFAEGNEPPGDNASGRPEWWSQPRFYVLQTTLDRDALLAAFAGGLDTKMVEHLRRVTTGFLDAECSIGVWTARPVDRMEAAVRQRVGIYLQRTFGITAEKGWIWEGIGLLLSSSVTGTKNLVYVKLNTGAGTVASDGHKPRQWELFGAGADWLAMARDLLRATPPPNLAPLLGKSVNTMDKEDLLLAHALGTWLVDGHPERASQVLARIGAGQPSVTVLEDEFALPLPEIVAQLAAWLEAVRPAR